MSRKIFEEANSEEFFTPYKVLRKVRIGLLKTMVKALQVC
jgi:hypothetical protein